MTPSPYQFSDKLQLISNLKQSSVLINAIDNLQIDKLIQLLVSISLWYYDIIQELKQRKVPNLHEKKLIIFAQNLIFRLAKETTNELLIQDLNSRNFEDNNLKINFIQNTTTAIDELFASQNTRYFLQIEDKIFVQVLYNLLRINSSITIENNFLNNLLSTLEIKKRIGQIIRNSLANKIGKDMTSELLQRIDYLDTQEEFETYGLQIITELRKTEKHQHISILSQLISNDAIKQFSEGNTQNYHIFEFRMLSDGFLAGINKFKTDLIQKPNPKNRITQQTEPKQVKQKKTPSQNSTQKEDKNQSSKNKNIKSIRAFKWLAEKKQLDYLYENLKGIFIEENDLFYKAFSQSPVLLKEPLNIKWQITTNKNEPNKRCLFYLLSQLETKRLIEKEKINDINYCNLIALIFCDNEGKSLLPLNDSYSKFHATIDKLTIDKSKQINEIVEQIYVSMYPLKKTDRIA